MATGRTGLSLGIPIRRVLAEEIITGILVGLTLGVLFLPFTIFRWGRVDVAVAVSIALLGWELLVPAGSKFVFQMHYTAAGTAQPDRSCLGVVFADPKSIKHRVNGGVCGSVSFAIPPGDPDYVMTAEKKMRRDTLLVGFMPHLHVRGTAFRYEAAYPDGRREVLLDVPKYDFNWQLWYRPEQPLLMPKGSRLICTAHYDNSADNVYNPDPTATVRFGEQTWDEMMFGWYVWIDPNEDLSNPQEDEERVAEIP